MSDKRIEIVIDTRTQLWLQAHWLIVACVAAVLFLVAGMFIPAGLP